MKMITGGTRHVASSTPAVAIVTGGPNAATAPATTSTNENQSWITCERVICRKFMHFATGTPEILNTVAPVLALGSLYCVAYVANLERELRKRFAAQGAA